MTFAFKHFSSKLNVCSRTRVEATVHAVPYLALCTVHAHWAANYTFMSTFVDVCCRSTPVTITAVGQEVFPHTMERQAIQSPSSKQNQTDFCQWAHTCARERIWIESVLRVHVRSIGPLRRFPPLLGCLPIMSQIDICWIHIYWPTLRWLKTWLLIARQLYQDSNGQTISLTGREQKDEEETAKTRDTGKTARHEWSWL